MFYWIFIDLIYNISSQYVQVFLYIISQFLRHNQQFLRHNQKLLQDITRIKMDFHTNQQIMQFLGGTPGRLRIFLLQVPKDDLIWALETKEAQADLINERRRMDNAFRQNVLDFTLQQVIKTCKDENLINYFLYRLANEQTRLQNHSQYGLKLANKIPQKYYVGKRSKHFNHARQIQQSYGIYNPLSQQEDGQQRQADQANQEEQPNAEEQENQAGQAIQAGEQQRQNGSEDDSFINEEIQYQSQNSQEQQINQISAHKQQIKMVKKRGRPHKKIRKLSDSRQKKGGKQQKNKSLKKQAQLIGEDINLQEYLVQPSKQKRSMRKQADKRKAVGTRSSIRHKKMMIDSD